MTVELAVWLLIILPGVITTAMNVLTARGVLENAKIQKPNLVKIARSQLVIQILLFIGLFGGLIVGLISIGGPDLPTALKFVVLTAIMFVPASITLASIYIRRIDYS